MWKNIRRGPGKMREKRRYKIINVETGKIIINIGRLQYFRTKTLANMEIKKLENELPIKLVVVEKEWKKENQKEEAKSLPQE